MVCCTGRVFNNTEQTCWYFLRILLPISFSFALILTFFPVWNHPPYSIVYRVCPSVFCCNLFNNLFCYLSLYILQLFIRHLSPPLLTVYGMRSMIKTKLALSGLRSGTSYGGDCGGSVAWWGYCSTLRMEVKEWMMYEFRVIKWHSYNFMYQSMYIYCFFSIYLQLFTNLPMILLCFLM